MEAGQGSSALDPCLWEVGGRTKYVFAYGEKFQSVEELPGVPTSLGPVATLMKMPVRSKVSLLSNLTSS